MTTTMRIDAHLHFWKPACGFDNKPIADDDAYRRDFLPQDVRPELDAARIDAAILVQTAPQKEESEWLLELARAKPWILGVTAWVDLDADTCDLEGLLAQPKVVGIRAQLRRIADPAFIMRPTVLRNLASILSAGLAVTILAERRHYEYVDTALQSLPAGPVTLNHLGMPFPDVDRQEWRAAMRRFGERPELYVQLSGLPFLFGSRWREPDVQQILDDVLDIFGPRRLLFASDWPMLVRFATYGDWVQAADAFLRRRALTADERDQVFGGNALRANPRISA